MLYHYLLLCNKVSPNVSVLKSKRLLFWSWYGLGILVWLSLVAIKMSAEVSDICRFDLYGRTFVQGGSLTFLLAGNFLFLSIWTLLQGCLCVLKTWQLLFPDKLSKRESKLGAIMCFLNESQISYAVTFAIFYSLAMSHWVQQVLKGIGIGSLFEERNVKECDYQHLWVRV